LSVQIVQKKRRTAGTTLTISCHTAKQLGLISAELPGRSDYTYSKNVTQAVVTRNVTSGLLIKRQSESSPEIQARQKFPFFGIFPLAEILRPGYTTGVGWEKFNAGIENNGQSHEGKGRTDEASNPTERPPTGFERLILPRWRRQQIKPNIAQVTSRWGDGHTTRTSNTDSLRVRSSPDAPSTRPNPEGYPRLDHERPAVKQKRKNFSAGCPNTHGSRWSPDR
jgi:hypothetical protein